MTMVSERYGIERRDALKVIGSAAAVGIGGVAGCLGGESGETGISGAELHFITVAQAPGIKDLWQGIASDFEDETSATVEVEFVQANSLDRIIQLLQAGDPPEVATLSLGDTLQLYNRDVLRPLNEEFQTAVDNIGQPTPAAEEIVTIQDDKWLVPFLHNINVFNYRSDLTDIVPDTWERALEYARVIDEQDNDVRGTYVPITGSSPGSIRLYSWAFQNGVKYSRWENEEITVAFDEEPHRGRMIETLNYLRERQQYSPSGEGAGWADIQNIIQSGQVASTWYGGVRPKNAAIRNGRPFANDVELLPGMPTKSDDVNIASTEGFVSFEGANTEAAKAFIGYVADLEFLSDLLVQLSPIHNVPSWPAIKDSDAYMDGITSLDIWSGWTMEQFETYQTEAFEGIIDNEMEVSPPNPYSVTYRSEPIQNLIGDVLRNDRDPASVIDQRAQELQTVIDDTQNA